MSNTALLPHFEQLSKALSGSLHFDSLSRVLYATDASTYREMPDAVAYPRHVADLQELVRFAKKHHLPLIARTAGTSLAGQCVGRGIIVDTSQHFTEILELNVAERWVRVQPGVIRDHLNAYLKPFGLFFGPVTATANRAMLGGMVGNNSCGQTSIVYGTTRDHLLELKTVLSDGSLVTFGALTNEEFEEKTQLQTLEGQVYRQIQAELSDPAAQDNIRKEFPKPNIHRRNTGYAVDVLLGQRPFHPEGEHFNFCALLCGSEGTLAFTTEITLSLDPLPEPFEVVVAPHFASIRDCMLATQFAMKHRPFYCEMMDKIILDCTRDNITQSKNRAFVQGDPKALLLIEFRGKSREEAESKADVLIADLQEKGLGYASPKVFPPAVAGVWELRRAGLGLLSNLPGDMRGADCIEDTAVALEDLADYIEEFEAIMEGFGQEAVYYAHAGAGELHLRPILNMKTVEGVRDFVAISEASARLVKKYRGSLSGEHGDGRLRAPFIPLMVGAENYELLRRIKQTWDPDGILNPGKIVDAAPMDTALRNTPGQETPDFPTVMDFSEVGGILRMAEKCNGSADCRKMPASGGTMCPSYQATRQEKDTTRARANTLREFLTKNTQPNAFDHEELKTVMDLCLSCKGCTSECPSSVDMSSMKAEFLHQYQKTHGVPFRSRLFGRIAEINRFASFAPGVFNFFQKNNLTAGIVKKMLGVAEKRSLPTLHPTTLKAWFQKNKPKPGTKPIKSVYFFCDEFTNYLDTPVGIAAIKLLTALGYWVQMVEHPESGRAAISKGLLTYAQKLARQNHAIFSPLISEECPLLGIEPSAILSFRDEYPRLVDAPDRESARKLGKNAILVEEFLYREFQAGNIRSDQFDNREKHILLHGHCHQKALSSVDFSAWALAIPKNHRVEVIPSGCCGMAGSFGYEKEHYEVSMAVGELVLFPAVRKNAGESIIAAPGTSCRHQIADGTARTALHPVQILWESFLLK